MPEYHSQDWCRRCGPDHDALFVVVTIETDEFGIVERAYDDAGHEFPAEDWQLFAEQQELKAAELAEEVARG